MKPSSVSIRIIVFFGFLISTMIVVRLQAQTTSAEYQVKAVFLFNFAQFVEWPDSAFADAQSPLVIGVYGVDPFGDYLDKIVMNENVGGHPLRIERYDDVSEIKKCHILFAGLSGGSQSKQLLEYLSDTSILTVSDDPSFIRQGGMVRFVTQKSKIRFQINPELAKNSGLTISSKLLRLAEIVVP